MVLSMAGRMLRRMALAAAVTIVPTTSAFAWPDRPIQLIVPLAAGGGTDLIARMVATLMEQDLGQPITVVNRPGGNALVGLTQAAGAAPDGYTLAAIPSELAFFVPTGQGALTHADFTMIGMYNLDPVSIHVRTDSPYQNAEELFEAIAADPTAFSAGGAGIGSINHLAYVGLLEALGIPTDGAVFVPTQGAGPAVQALAAGTLDLTFTQMAEAHALVDAGELRPIALLGEERDPKFPDVPTVAEALGVDFTLGGWRGIAAPAGLPEDIRAQLQDSLQRAVESEEFQTMMDQGKFTIRWLDGEAFSAFHAEQDATIAAGLTAAGLAQ